MHAIVAHLHVTRPCCQRHGIWPKASSDSRLQVTQGSMLDAWRCNGNGSRRALDVLLAEPARSNCRKKTSRTTNADAPPRGLLA
eukprot:9538363-Alexandrium_andersonii.AAC.1